ncbi:MAG: Flp pilus assembly protein CpaB [Anaerolineae bacterium]
MEKNKRRSVVFLGIAVLLAIVAGAIYFNWMGQLQRDLQETEQVVVASKDIRTGTLITPEMLEVRMTAPKYAQGSYFKSLEDIVGPLEKDQFGDFVKDESGNIVDPDLLDNAVALMDLDKGDQIQRASVDQNAGLMPNMRAVTIGVNRMQSVGGAVRAGNRVDILVSYIKGGEGQEMGTEPAAVTEVLFQDVKVLAVSLLAPEEEEEGEEEVEEKAVARPARLGPARFMPSGQLMDEATVTLALSLEDAVKLTYMANFGQEVRLLIRRYEERETPDVEPVTVDSF